MSGGAERGLHDAPAGSEAPASEPVSTSEDRLHSLLAELARAPAVAQTGPAPLQPPPSWLGRFQLLGELGRGGFGIVYEAVDTELRRHVAIKALRTDRLGPEGSDERKLRIALFKREAEACARLHHPNVITLHDFGVQDGCPYLVLELLRGQSLDDRLQRGPVPPGEARRITLEVCRALVHAHAAGVVHRDLKPANVFVTEQGAVKVLDLGLARVFEGGTLAGGGGTPGFMAPEQALGGPGDERSDVFGAAALYVYLVRGDRAPKGSPPLSGAQAELARRTLAGPEGELIARALDPQPARRPQSARELLDGLEQLERRKARRKRIAIGSAIALTTLAAIVVARVQAQRALRCSGAAERVATAWSGAKGEELAASFAALDKPWAADAAASVRRTLDAYASAWARQHTDACEATRLRGEQSEELLDLRMACLERRRSDLGAVAALLAKPDLALAVKSVSLVHQLAPLDECANAEALRMPARLPRDPAARAQLEPLFAQASELRALRLGGKYARALEVGTELAKKARAAGYRPLEAEVLCELGSTQIFGSGDFNAAAETLTAAYVAALAGGDVLHAAQALIDLVYDAGEKLSQTARAHEYARAAEALIERAGGNPSIESRLRRMQHGLAVTEGKYADALRFAERSYELALQSDGPRTVRTAAAYQVLGEALRLVDRYPEALEVHRKAVPLYESILGPEHPNVAVAVNSLAVDLHELHQAPDEVIALWNRALRMREASLGKEHDEVAAVLGNLGHAYAQAGRFDEGLAVLERAIAIRSKVRGKDHPSLGYAYNNLAVLEGGRGRWREAVAAARRSAAVREKGLGPKHPLLSESLITLAHAQLRAGDRAGALESARRGVQVAESSLAADHQQIADALAHLSEALLGSGRAAEALPAAERALAIAAKKSDPFELAQARLAVAAALRALGRDLPRAQELASQAQPQLAAAGPLSSDDARLAAALAAR